MKNLRDVTLILLLGAAACSSNDSAGPIDSGSGSDASAGGGSDVGLSPDQASGGSGGADGTAGQGGVGAGGMVGTNCNTLAVTGPLVESKRRDASVPLPTAMGGSLVSGTYQSTEVWVYQVSASCTAMPRPGALTIRINAATAQSGTIEWANRDPAGDNARVIYSYMTSGQIITLARICPDASSALPPMSWPFSATANEISFFIQGSAGCGVSVMTLVRQ